MGQTRTVVGAFVLGAAFVSPFMFPLAVTVFLALCAALVTPLAPLAIGILIDALYGGVVSSYPIASLVGAVASLLAFFIERYIKTSIMYA